MSQSKFCLSSEKRNAFRFSLYINVYPLRDVIEKPITAELDISGWDLVKAFGLLRKSNPALMEWVRSPLVYQELQPQVETFRRLAEGAFLPTASCHHYRSMAQKHQMRSAKKERVRLKHYLYTLRPCLSARWVIEKGTQPPMLFADLVEVFLPSGEVRAVVDRLVVMKSDSTEKDSVERIAVLDEFIDQNLKTVEENLPGAVPAMSKAACNEQFRRLLKACWDEN